MARTYELHCADGNIWEFNDPDSPVALRTDPTGIEGAPFTHDDQANVDQAGVTWRARIDQPGVLGLDVKFGPVDKTDALDMYRTWRHSLGRGKDIHEFHVLSDEAGDRFQYVRLLTQPAMNLRSVLDIGWVQSEQFALRSDESWWRKTPATKTFAAGGFAGASIVSDSDEPVWPHWSITGPITTPTIGLTGDTVTLPTIGAGQTWTIDTDPDYWAIRDHLGVDRSWLGDRWRAKVPAGSNVTVPLVISGGGTTGATSVTVTLPQLFWTGV